VERRSGAKCATKRKSLPALAKKGERGGLKGYGQFLKSKRRGPSKSREGTVVSFRGTTQGGRERDLCCPKKGWRWVEGAYSWGNGGHN